MAGIEPRPCLGAACRQAWRDLPEMFRHLIFLHVFPKVTAWTIATVQMQLLEPGTFKVSYPSPLRPLDMRGITLAYSGSSR
jgi:hypothetical protein